MILDRDQAATIAAFVRPQIKAYIEAHRDEYENWLEFEQLNMSSQKQRKTKSGGLCKRVIANE